MMDDNDDGGNGSGLFIDDIKVVRTIDNSLIPIAENLRANNESGLIALTWDSPPIIFNNDLVQYDDGTFEDHVWMSSGTALAGTYFSMPDGSEDVFYFWIVRIRTFVLCRLWDFRFSVFGFGNSALQISGFEFFDF